MTDSRCREERVYERDHVIVMTVGVNKVGVVSTIPIHMNESVTHGDWKTNVNI